MWSVFLKLEFRLSGLILGQKSVKTHNENTKSEDTTEHNFPLDGIAGAEEDHNRDDEKEQVAWNV